MEHFTSCEYLLDNTPSQYHAKVLSNVDLFHITTFSQLFTKGCTCIYLLYPWRESNPNIGHWCLLTKRGPIINFFDPYAFDVDGHAIRRALRHITRLMYKDFGRYHFYKNTVPLQRMKHGINTCGRWCLLFMNDPDGYEETVDIDDWAKKIKNRADEAGMSNDEFLIFIGGGVPQPGPRLAFQPMKFYKDDEGNMKLLPENERGQIQRQIFRRRRQEKTPIILPKKTATVRDGVVEIELDPTLDFVPFAQMIEYLGNYLTDAQIQMIQDEPASSIEGVFFTDMVAQNQMGNLKFLPNVENVAYLLKLYDNRDPIAKDDLLRNPDTRKIIKRKDLEVLGALLEIPFYNVSTGRNNLKKNDLIVRILAAW